MLLLYSRTGAKERDRNPGLIGVRLFSATGLGITIGRRVSFTEMQDSIVPHPLFMVFTYA